MDSQTDVHSNWRRPRIAIRKRTLDETVNLSVRLICSEWKELSFYFGVLAIPILILDFLVWGFPLAAYVSKFDTTFTWTRFSGAAFCFGLCVWFTIAIETRFMGSLVTQYLGLWLFSGEDKIPHKRVFKSWRERWFQLLYYLGPGSIVRLSVYYTETILLERHPFWGKKGEMTTRRRVRLINSGGVGIEAELIRLMLGSFLLFAVFSGWGVLYGLLSVVIDDRRLAFIIAYFGFFPVILTGSRLFSVVFNFCSYVNYRISCEGWDVDLTFKTELARLSAIGTTATVASARGRRRSRTLEPLVLDSVAVGAVEQPVGSESSSALGDVLNADREGEQD